MADRKELLAEREAALKELKRTDAVYHKTCAAEEAAEEKHEIAERVHTAASSDWDDAEEIWGDAVRALAEYDAAHADEFV